MKSPCLCCGHVREIESRGLCSSCRKRIRPHRTLVQWGHVKADRRRDYAEARDAGWSLEYAAWSAGVSVRTAFRYEAELRENEPAAA